MLLVVLLGGLGVTDCVSIRTFVNVEPTQAAIRQDSPTKVKEKAVPTAAAPIDLPVKTTNASTEPIVIPSKIQSETNNLSHETAPSLKSVNSSALNNSHSNDNLPGYGHQRTIGMPSSGQF